MIVKRACQNGQREKGNQREEENASVASATSQMLEKSIPERAHEIAGLKAD